MKTKVSHPKTAPFIGAAILLASLLASPAQATGTLDFVDPCIEAKAKFQDARRDKLHAIDKEIRKAKTAEVSEEDMKRALARVREREKSKFVDAAGDVIRTSGGSIDKAFNAWYAKQLTKMGGEKALREKITQQYRAWLEQEYRTARQETAAQFDAEGKKLKEECAPDVASQLTRASMAALVKPVTQTVQQWEAAKDESGELSKAAKATIDVSLDDIATGGLLGGDKSDARNFVEKTLGVGRNHEVRKLGRKIDQVLNPFR